MEWLLVVAVVVAGLAWLALWPRGERAYVAEPPLEPPLPFRPPAHLWCRPHELGEPDTATAEGRAEVGS